MNEATSLLRSLANVTKHAVNATVETTIMATPLATTKSVKKLSDFIVPSNKASYNIEAEYLYTSLIDIIPIIAGQSSLLTTWSMR